MTLQQRLGGETCRQKASWTLEEGEGADKDVLLKVQYEEPKQKNTFRKICSDHLKGVQCALQGPKEQAEECFNVADSCFNVAELCFNVAFMWRSPACTCGVQLAPTSPIRGLLATSVVSPSGFLWPHP